MDVKSTHTEQVAEDALWRIKQDTFFRIMDQVGQIHVDDQIPPLMKNISLYLESDADNTFIQTKFQGIYRATRYNVTIREFSKFDDNNWVVYIDVYNIPDIKDGVVTDLNIENSFAQIEAFTIGAVDGVIMIAPREAERLIAITEDFETKKLKVCLKELREFMALQENRNGYKTDQFDDEVYIIDSPAPMFAKDTVMYRDSDYVGMWISFGTLLKFDLRNLNVFNIDGVKVGAVDIGSGSPQINALKLLSNSAYGYASILFDKESLFSKIMDYSRRYVYETNMEDGTRICVDNILETLQEKGILGLLYEDFDVVSNYPMMAFDEVTGEVKKILSTMIKFKYRNEYIYMVLDMPNNKMYFASYAGRIQDFYNSKYEYNVKIMNDMWITKVNDISPDNFILFTGFPNLQHNKVIDIYFDDTIETFSDLDKSFSIDVTEFDGFYRDSVLHPNEESYDRNTDLVHSYGNNPFPLVSGLIAYQPKDYVGRTQRYELDTHAEPIITTFIDPENKAAYLMVPGVKTNCLVDKMDTPIGAHDFINNYMVRWFKGEDVDEWIKEAEQGGFAHMVRRAYYNNGWTIVKTGEDTYSTLKLNSTRLMYVYNGAVEHLCYPETQILVDMAEKLRENMSESEVKQEVMAQASKVADKITAKVMTQIRAIDTQFIQEIMEKSNQVVSVVDYATPRFDFDRFEDADNIYVNNAPSGPVLNHALLFEDTFHMMQQKMKSEYFDDMGFEILPAEVYCPYFKGLVAEKSGDITHIEVTSDMSNSIEILKNKSIGIRLKGDSISREGTINVEGNVFSVKDAYTKNIELNYFGVRTINGEDFNIYKLTTFTTMSDAVRDAYAAGFTEFTQKASEDAGVDYEEQKRYIHGIMGIDSSPTEIEVPPIPSGQPLYIANIENKLMVSLDGNSFMDAPIGSDGVELSARITIEDKVRFLSMLRNIVNADKNSVSFKLSYAEAHVADDVYSVGVKEMWIDHTDILTRGTVSVTARMFVDNGQIVLDDNHDIIYSQDDEFMITKEVDIDGYVSDDGDRLKILVNMDVIYYTSIPTTDITYGTAQELMIQDTTYKIRLGLPVSLSVLNGGYVFVDRDDAHENGVSGWFDFTKMGD